MRLRELTGQEIAAHSRRRPGHRPEWARPLDESQRLGDAALDALARDADLIIMAGRLAANTPGCVSGIPGRLLREHASTHRVCAEWVDGLTELARRAGCPSLDSIGRQVALKAADATYLLGTVRILPLTAADARPGGRRGLDHPARLLLARRWHASGMAWDDVGGRLAALVNQWSDDDAPAYPAEAYPAWHEWIGLTRHRELLRHPPAARDAVREQWLRGAVPDAQRLRRGVAELERILVRELGPSARRPAQRRIHDRAVQPTSPAGSLAPRAGVLELAAQPPDGLDGARGADLRPDPGQRALNRRAGESQVVRGGLL